MKSSKTNKLTRWVRVIHRDLGFLMVGVCLVYGISGILLNHMHGQDPAYRTRASALQLEPGLTRQELTTRWQDSGDTPALRRVLPVDEGHERLMLDGGAGIYDLSTGLVSYETHTRRQFVYWINKLHYNKVKGWSLAGDIFAISLIFFALSGLLMAKGKNGATGRGKWFLLAGLLVPVLYVLLG
ncbi:MAG: PepSY-associated TM helix domain-containing protein [Odoribacteraceae bacterium]|jgi:hypothetical protein|nr:PepSY-associated TM helix domain-containing protein [Odoribacteraceae bacterium]